MSEENESRRKAMKKIHDEVLTLTDSSLYKYRTENNYLPVIGEGSHEAKIMFVGEAPGRNEAKTGRPFHGHAGKILDELLASVDIKREEVYITNIVKDRPPENRDPLPNEIELYGPFLDRQIEIIKPVVIATLGRFSMTYILQRLGVEELGPISALHGKIFDAETSYGKVKIVPLYHPAAAIYARALKGTLLEDFKVLKNIIT